MVASARESRMRILIVLLALASVCSEALCAQSATPDEIAKAFAAAQDTNSIEAYRGFLASYPDSPYTTLVKEYIAELEAFREHANERGKFVLDLSQALDKGGGAMGRRLFPAQVFSLDNEGHIGGKAAQSLLVDADRKFLTATPMLFTFKDQDGQSLYLLLPRGLKPGGADTANVVRIDPSRLAVVELEKSFLRQLLQLTPLPLLTTDTPAPKDLSREHAGPPTPAAKSASPSPPAGSGQHPEPPIATERVKPNQEVQHGGLVKGTMPAYPPLAKQAGVQGVVLFSAVIGTDGSVQNLKLIGGHPLLVPAAMEAVKKWVYEPTRVNGKPVAIEAQIDVKFALEP
jgi:TonB family protein